MGGKVVRPMRGGAAEFEETRLFDPTAPDGVGAAARPAVREATAKDTGFAETRLFDPTAPDGVGQRPSMRRSLSAVERLFNQAQEAASGPKVR
jgi:hypothetical protein